MVSLSPIVPDMDLSRPLTDLHEIWTQVGRGVKPENQLSKIFLPPPKLTGEPKIYFRLSRTAISRKGVTSKRLNTSTNK